MRAFLLISVLVLLVGGIVYAQKTEGEAPASEPDPKQELAASIARGKVLFDDPALGTSGMMCSTCHAEGGTVDGSMGEMKVRAFDRLAKRFPKYWAMSGRVMTLDQAVNFCVVNPLKGTALAWDSQELTDLVAYCASVEPAPPAAEADEPDE